MTAVTTIEGIGASAARKLEKAGIRSTEQLLDACCDSEGRSRIAGETGIGEDRLLRLVNHADLMRIRGIGGEFAEILEAAGVDSVPELAQRNADNLAASLSDVNAEKKLVRRIPTSKQLAGWIEEAGRLDSRVTH